MTERNYHQVRREIRLMQQIAYEGAVELRGTFEDASAIYLVQEICAKVGEKSKVEGRGMGGERRCGRRSEGPAAREQQTRRVRGAACAARPRPGLHSETEAS